MRPALATPPLVGLAVLWALAGCRLGLGPLPPEVDGLVDYLSERNLQLAVDDVAYDRAFDAVDPEAHVVTYRVTALQPRALSSGPPALIDVYPLQTPAEVEAGIAGLRRLHDRGELYTDGTLVLYVRGDAPDLALALGRRYGVPLAI
jgi:hypothetical protein